MNIEKPAQLDVDVKIHNIENEIQMLSFHKESLEMEIGFIRPKLQSSNITVVKNLSEARQELMQGFKTQWKEEDIPARKQFFHAYDELSETVRRINSLQLQLEGYNKHRSQVEQRTASGFSDTKLRELFREAKRLLKSTVDYQKRAKLHIAIDEYQKGFINLQSKQSYYDALKVLLMQLK